jgi:hypothetical protein
VTERWEMVVTDPNPGSRCGFSMQCPVGPTAGLPAGVVAAAAMGFGRMPAPGGRRSRTTRSSLLEREPSLSWRSSTALSLEERSAMEESIPGRLACRSEADCSPALNWSRKEPSRLSTRASTRANRSPQLLHLIEQKLGTGIHSAARFLQTGIMVVQIQVARDLVSDTRYKSQQGNVDWKEEQNWGQASRNWDRRRSNYLGNSLSVHTSLLSSLSANIYTTQFTHSGPRTFLLGFFTLKPCSWPVASVSCLLC